MGHDIVHWISKDARYRIIELMLSTRSTRQLAEELGVSPAAVNKYIRRATHPSDDTIRRALEILGEYEKERVLQVIIDDILGALEAVINDIVDDNIELKNYLRGRLENILKSIEK